jgi:hypothetical protein
MKKTRGFKHYFRFWVIATLLYTAYVSYLAYTEGYFNPAVLVSVGILPVLFTFLLFVFDQIFDRIWPTKEKKTDDEFNDFLNKTTTRVNEKLELSIEDFRRLRENEKFQRSLYQAYQIYLIGETEDINYTLLNKKFKKETIEYNALMIVIKEVKEMMEN